MKNWIQGLTDKDRESFLAFCKRASSPIQMYLYARFLRFTGSIVDVEAWVKKEFKKRNFNLILESEIDSMSQDIAKLRDGIDMGMVKADMGTARIAMLQKELRGTIKQLNDEKNLMDKQAKGTCECILKTYFQFARKRPSRKTCRSFTAKKAVRADSKPRISRTVG